mgnify:CR=1 FL=1
MTKSNKNPKRRAVFTVCAVLAVAAGLFAAAAAWMNSPEKLLDKGLRLLSENHYEAAGEAFEKVLEKDEGLAEAYSGLAKARRGLGKNGEAAAALKKGLEALPRDETLILELARLYRGGGDISAALDTLYAGRKRTGSKKISAEIDEIESSVDSPDITAMTVGDTRVRVREFTYYYGLVYAYYQNEAKKAEALGAGTGFDAAMPPDRQNVPVKPGEEPKTWAEHFKEEAASRACKTAALYTEAVKAKKYGLTENDKTAVDAQLDALRKTAAAANLSVDEYLTGLYGDGVDYTFIKSQLEKETVVQKYSNDKYNGFLEACTDEVVKALYEAGRDKFDVVSLRIYNFPAADANAKQKAEAMLDGVSGEASFLKLATRDRKAISGLAFDAALETALFLKDKASIETYISGEAAAWAFESSRAAGDKTVVRTQTDYVVMWIKTPPFPPETVDVRHILIPFKTDAADTAAPSGAEIRNAGKKAEDIYSLYLKGEKTERSFADLAEKHSADTGSNANGGLYAGLSTGQTAATFENWCFDANRKPGDIGIIKAAYGYHVLYFVRNNTGDFIYEEPLRNAKAAEDYAKYEASLLRSDEYKAAEIETNTAKSVKAALEAINSRLPGNAG